MSELIIFIVMAAAFLIGCFVFKLSVSISMVIASILGALVSGNGIPIRHLVEGTFGYVDTILIIATAMTFMAVLTESGALQAINAAIIKRFYKKPAILLVLLMFIIMIPGMITGSSSAAVLTAGAIAGPIFAAMGIPAASAAAIVAIGGLLGMAAPPVNLPVMIIGGGIDMPYLGFTVPLLILTIPLAIFNVLFLGLRHVTNVDLDEIRKHINLDDNPRWIIYLPLLVLVILMVATSLFPGSLPNLGMPLIFIISSIIGIFTGAKFNVLKVSKDAMKTALPVLGILVSVGMFIQIMTLTGVRGFIVVNCISLPKVLLYAAIAITIPLFGSITAFGSASVLGVPFLLALIDGNQILTAAGISLIVTLGDLMPPTALAGIFAAQVLKLDSYIPVLKKCFIPALSIIIWGLVFIIFSKPLASIIPLI